MVQIWRLKPLIEEKVLATAVKKKLYKSLHNPKNDSQQKHDNGNLIDSVHHAKVVIRFLIWVRLLENTQKVVSKFTHIEESFYFIIVRHGLVLLGKQTGLDNGLIKSPKSVSGEAG